MGKVRYSVISSGNPTIVWNIFEKWGNQYVALLVVLNLSILKQYFALGLPLKLYSNSDFLLSKSRQLIFILLNFIYQTKTWLFIHKIDIKAWLILSNAVIWHYLTTKILLNRSILNFICNRTKQRINILFSSYTSNAAAKNVILSNTKYVRINIKFIWSDRLRIACNLIPMSTQSLVWSIKFHFLAFKLLVH